MKKIKIGKKEYEICETAEDLPIKRANALKEYMTYKMLKVDVPDLVQTLQRFMQNYDNESKSQMIITLNDYLTGMRMVQGHKDPDQLAFAVITKTKGEEWFNFDESKGIEKLDEMANEGLTQGLVDKEVENFIKASSTHWVTYFRESLLEQMGMSLG